MIICRDGGDFIGFRSMLGKEDFILKIYLFLFCVNFEILEFGGINIVISGL